jgi:hypothetical protein
VKIRQWEVSHWDKNMLTESLGQVSWERQRQIQSKLKEVFRL